MKLLRLISICLLTRIGYSLVIPSIWAQTGKSPGVFNIDSDSPSNIIHHAASPIPNQYIVLFKSDTTDIQRETHLATLNSWLLNTDPQYTILHSFQLAHDLQGYTSRLPEQLIRSLATDPIIQSIEQDSYVHALGRQKQIDSPWGLARISQRERLKLLQDQFYHYDDSGASSNTKCYILDTGINENHNEFQGRAKWGAVFTPMEPNQEDENGHGTHCAGVIGSHEYGVAKNTTLIAVKVLDARGDGEMSAVIRGIEYVTQQHEQDMKKQDQTGFKGSVINLSLGAGKSPALLRVIEAAVKLGVHFAVAAGNEDDDACSTSPADSPHALTVGASSFSDDRVFFSNWGPCVDVFAPGINIMSTYIGPHNNETTSLSGTSMSAPFVTGLIAYFLSLQPDTKSQFYTGITSPTPYQLKYKIISFSTEGVLHEIPEGTPNRIVYNGGGHSLKDFWNN
ncbi:hypothetical protein NCAS_0D02630 [Naumovozyma castellii]|uniref:Peptidase S8/S53 domain-containing protein n=1 Tax=Naumovozyma castellii TaxID=27288 RepID=G0VE53_NAUCA|nr:hypothetical protein NCAS_0D02630 [Naumovozyma castellii CBS 4309]CCC69844.1 hypothetical protein NCAS_0D02630 [Naumovozyma castellii CBS 4309]